MGLRGPKAKPTSIKTLLGNPGRRPLNEHEPVAPLASIAPPKLLRANARPYWDDLAPVLIAMRVLTSADVPAFARYCNLLARYKELDDLLMTKGSTGTTYPIKDANGKTRGVAEWPMAWELRQLLNQLLVHEREFGLTPSSRSKLRVEPVSSTAMTPAANEKSATLQQFFAAGGPAPPRPAVDRRKAGA